MSETPVWRRYTRLWGPDPKADMEDEFEFHVRERVEELIALGMDARRAREEAVRGFGDMERVKATCLHLARERQEAMKRQEQLSVLWQDAVYAVRQMRAQPLLTFAALLTLAVGIGATTAIFSVVNAVLLRPLPYRDADRIVILWESYREFPQGRASPAHFRDWTEQSTTLDRTAAWVSRNYNLTGAGDPERVVGASVTPGWFDVLHMPPAAGRYFLPGEDAAGARVVVLSHELWQNRFGGERSIVGRDVQLNGEAFTVVGVAPAGYRLTEFDEQLWTTLHIPPPEMNYGNHGLFVIGRMKPGVTRAMVQADIERVTEGIRQRQPNEMQSRGVTITRYTDTLIGDYRMQLLVLLGAVLFVLLIACGNVASLLLARATTRHKELAIRAALGSGRARLIRQLLTESVVLAGSGGAIGVLLAWFGVRTLVAAAPRGVPRIYEAGLDGNVLLFAVGATLLCGLLFGLAPALRASRTDLQSVLREGGKTSRGSGARDRLRSVLVVGEIAVALVLVVGAGLFIRSSQQVQRVPLGFTPEGVTMARLSLPQERYGEPAVTIATYARLLEELRAQPGVASAAFATRAPLWGGSIDIGLGLRDFPREPGQMQIAHVRLVSNGYFETLEIPLLKGRLLQASDMRAGAPPVVVMNERLARESFGEANPLGQFVTGWNLEGEEIWREVVGVVANVRSFGRESETPPELFYPYSQAPGSSWSAFQRSVALLARSAGGSDVTDAMRTAVRTIDPTLPLFDVRRMSDVLALNFAGRRFNMMLLSLLGIAGLVLAAVGIYGVVGFFVMQRTQEIGVRMALGATAGDVLRLVLLHGGRLTVLGIVAGAAASMAVTRVLTSMLFEVNARDPITFAGGALVLGLAATLAAWLPARRATRVEPLRSLSGG